MFCIHMAVGRNTHDLLWINLFNLKKYEKSHHKGVKLKNEFIYLIDFDNNESSLAFRILCFIGQPEDVSGEIEIQVKLKEADEVGT